MSHHPIPTNGARFSECKKYRYLLWRTWDAGKSLGVIMLNPSTADEVKNDPTVERCERRARQLRYGSMLVGNLYGFRATDPRKMKAAADPVGWENDLYLNSIGSLCPTVLLAWGTHAEPARAAKIIDMLRRLPQKPKLTHLGLTKGGQPRHPLYVGYDTPLQELTA